jgi:23S rRNA (pseudouridine1915-N3)-methyltransferase
MAALRPHFFYFLTSKAMQIKLVVLGKTDHKAIQELIADYSTRLGHYIRFELEVIPDLKQSKSLSETLQKEKEGELILKKVLPSDEVFLLDARGKSFSSLEFADFFQKKMNSGLKQLVLVIGGPYGFSESVYERANGKISLSKMTLSHQMIRPFLIEQMYRAMTILRNEPYHHE